MPKILLVGQDVRLLETRSAVLKKTGAEVVYCVGCQVFDVVALESPDLVVLCHSLSEVEAEMIADKGPRVLPSDDGPARCVSGERGQAAQGREVQCYEFA